MLSPALHVSATVSLFVTAGARDLISTGLVRICCSSWVDLSKLLALWHCVVRVLVVWPLPCLHPRQRVETRGIHGISKELRSCSLTVWHKPRICVVERSSCFLLQKRFPSPPVSSFPNVISLFVKDMRTRNVGFLTFTGTESTHVQQHWTELKWKAPIHLYLYAL